MHIDEVLIQQQLYDLLDIPDWYRAIVLGQLPPKLCFALYKATRKRGDTELRHRLQGRTEEDMVRIDLPNSAMDQLEVALLEQLSSTAEHCSFKLLFCQVKFLYGEVSSIINLLRSLSGD